MQDIVHFIIRFALFAAVHSVLAAVTVKERLEKMVGTAMRGYRLSYNLVSILLFGWVLAAWRDAPVIYHLPRFVALPMRVGQGFLLVILVRCAVQTGIVDFLGFRQLRGLAGRGELVTTGCYGRVRHPQYTAATAFLLLSPVMTAKWLVLTLLAVPYLVLGAFLEEARLVREFGDSYRRYRSEVPMFVPRCTRRGPPG